MSARPSRCLAPVPLAAVAAVLAACGTSYAGAHGPGRTEPSAIPTSSDPASAARPATDAGNRAAATAVLDQAMAVVPVYPGARVTGPMPQLRNATTQMDDYPGHTVSRSSYWTVPGTSAAVARWYAAHPPTGYQTVGGPTVREGETNDLVSGWVSLVHYVRPGRGSAPPLYGSAVSGAEVAVETTQVYDHVAIRTVGQVVWRPARPPASFVHHVRSIDVHEWIYRGRRTSTRSWTVTSRARLAAAVAVFNRLPGQLPGTRMCPSVDSGRRYRITFHTAASEVIVPGWVDACLDGLG